MEKLLSAVRSEIVRARAGYKPFNSTHEGYAVLAEEVDELWELVKRNKGMVS